MAAQPQLELSPEQQTLVDKIKPGAGVIFPRRHGATTALAHYVRTHATETPEYVAPSKRLADKFGEATDHVGNVCSETSMTRGGDSFLLLDGCRTENILSVSQVAFTILDPQFTVPQAGKLWFKGTAALMVVEYRTHSWCAEGPIADVDNRMRFVDGRVWCSKDFCIGDDMDVVIQDLRAKIIACANVYGDPTEEVFIKEAVYLDGDDLIRAVCIQLEL